MTNKMQLCRIIYYSLAALHVSSDIFAHHQEHLKCITASGITHVCRCRLTSLLVICFTSRLPTDKNTKHTQMTYTCGHILRNNTNSYTKMTNKMQLCRIIYYSLAALHVSSDIFAHHQEHLKCITASGITHVCRCRLTSLLVICFTSRLPTDKNTKHTQMTYRCGHILRNNTNSTNANQREE